MHTTLAFIYAGFNEEKDTWNLVQTIGMQPNFTFVQIFCKPVVGTRISVIRKNLANSCSRITLQRMLFMSIDSPELVSKVRILAKNWFGWFAWFGSGLDSFAPRCLSWLLIVLDGQQASQNNYCSCAWQVALNAVGQYSNRQAWQS